MNFSGETEEQPPSLRLDTTESDGYDAIPHFSAANLSSQPTDMQTESSNKQTDDVSTDRTLDDAGSMQPALRVETSSANETRKDCDTPTTISADDTPADGASPETLRDQECLNSPPETDSQETSMITPHCDINNLTEEESQDDYGNQLSDCKDEPPTVVGKLNTVPEGTTENATTSEIESVPPGTDTTEASAASMSDGSQLSKDEPPTAVGKLDTVPEGTTENAATSEIESDLPETDTTEASAASPDSYDDVDLRDTCVLEPITDAWQCSEEFESCPLASPNTEPKQAFDANN